MRYDIQNLLDEVKIEDQKLDIGIYNATKEICENYSDIFDDPDYKQFVLERQQLTYLLTSLNPKLINEATFAPSINTAKDLQDVMEKIEKCNAPSKTSFIIFKLCVNALAYGSTAVGGYNALFGDYGGLHLIDRITTFSLGFFLQHVIKYGAPFIASLYNWMHRIMGKDNRLSYTEKINMMRQALQAIDEAILKISTGKINSDDPRAPVKYALTVPHLNAIKKDLEKDIKEYEDWKSGALRGVLQYGY